MNALLFTAALLAQEPFAETVFTVPGPHDRIALRDMNGDRRLDLVLVTPEGFTVRYLREDGRYPEAHDAAVAFPSERVGWDLADLDGDGAQEIVMLVDGTDVRVWRPDETGRSFEAVDVLSDPAGHLPLGVYRTTFVRDVDGDGLADLTIPGSGRFRVHLQKKDGGFRDAVEITFEADVTYRVGDPDVLDSSFGESVRIPWMRLEDIDGDGKQDLVSQTSDLVRVYIGDSGLPSEPTWELDLAALRDQFDRGDSINLEDLFSNVAPQVAWRIAELDGTPPADLVLKLEGTFKVYLGGARTGVRPRPDDLLKASGTVLHFLLRDVGGSDLPDLQLIRAERVSIGTVVRWLVFPGTLDFDVFTYENEGGRFARKPSKRVTLALKIPRLLSMEDEFDEIEEELERRAAVPAKRLSLEGDGVLDDVVDVVGERILFFRGRVPAGFDERYFLAEGGAPDEILEKVVLEDLDDVEDGGKKELSIDDLKQLDLSEGYELRRACEGAAPVLDVPVAEPLRADDSPFLLVRDLNGDGVSDVILAARDAENRDVVQFLVTTP